MVETFCFHSDFLVKYNKDCKVVIICEKDQIFEDLINFSIEMNFEIYSDFITAYNMMYYRFEIYRKYLTNINLVFDKNLSDNSKSSKIIELKGKSFANENSSLANDRFFIYSTVTLLAKFLGLSTSIPFAIPV